MRREREHVVMRKSVCMLRRLKGLSFALNQTKNHQIRLPLFSTLMEKTPSKQKQHMSFTQYCLFMLREKASGQVGKDSVVQMKMWGGLPLVITFEHLV